MVAVLVRLAIHPLLGDTARYFLLIPTLFIATTIFGGIVGSVFLVCGTLLTLSFVIGENTISLTGGGTTRCHTLVDFPHGPSECLGVPIPKG